MSHFEHILRDEIVYILNWYRFGGWETESVIPNTSNKVNIFIRLNFQFEWYKLFTEATKISEQIYFQLWTFRFASWRARTHTRTQNWEEDE